MKVDVKGEQIFKIGNKELGGFGTESQNDSGKAQSQRMWIAFSGTSGQISQEEITRILDNFINDPKGVGREGNKLNKMGRDGITGKIDEAYSTRARKKHTFSASEFSLRTLRRKGRGFIMSIGLSIGGSNMNKIPGSYPGSIAFHSNGSVYLAGMKLVFESEKQDWAQPGKVIGCGFDPRQKKVFFTLDSELIHVVHCKSEDFGMPMYPIIVSNIDITAAVNLGQSSFSYGQANVNRTSNPCFTGGTSLEYDDSKELFSMERLDTEWLAHSATVRSTASNKNHHNNYYDNNNNKFAYDDESEAELFEIVLDSS
ncbi:hypothetical protein KSS87_016336 [Heliosperma pusillum]|nr:hypothetical protein KSS87_016336 [Heliosperma pusillum]